MKLTKREMILLIMLSIFALAFLEYQYLFIPMRTKYEKLVEKDQATEVKVKEINQLIKSTDALKTTKDKMLSDVNLLSASFFNVLNTDALLYNTHQVLIGSGLQYKTYQVADNKLTLLEKSNNKSGNSIYKLKVLAESFVNASSSSGASSVKPSVSPTPTPKPTGAKSAEAEKPGELESCSITIELTGSYDQLKKFITQIESLKKTISISTLNIKSAGVVGVIDAIVEINYFGVAKLQKSNDSINEWNAGNYLSGSGDPFLKEIFVAQPTVTPKPTLNTTTR